MKKLLVLSLLEFALFSCEETTKESELNNETAALDGKELMENNCYSCHNTQGTDNMLAPPMQRVKDHYWDEETSKQEFVSAIVEWCKNPTEEKSMMPGARRKFGLMPKQKFDEKEVEAIAGYLYDHDLDQSCCSSGH